MSDVDFEDVSWSIYTILDLSIANDTPPRGVDEDFFDAMYKRLEKIYDENYYEDYYVMYGGTNAKIDLSKSFEAKVFNGIKITNCDLSNIDLSSLEVNALSVIPYSRGFFSECNLTNTGIKLVYKDDEYVKYCDDYFAFFGSRLESNQEESLDYYINNMWNGCYVNGKLNSFMNTSSVFDDGSDYSHFEREEFERMLSSIDEQVSRDTEILKK